jgi:hypothetical protein
LAGSQLDGKLLLFDRLLFGLVGSLAENFVSVSPKVREFVFEWLDEDFTLLFEQANKGSGTEILVRIKPIGGERGEGGAELGEVGHFDGLHCGVVLEEPLDHTLILPGGEGTGGVQHVSARSYGTDGISEDATLATDVLVDLVGEEAFVSILTLCHERLTRAWDVADDEVKGFFEFLGINRWVSGPDSAALDLAAIKVRDEGSGAFSN